MIIYLEEILGQSEALWISKDGSRLAYIRFNDSLVELVTLREYGTPKDSEAQIKNTHLREKTFRYPKVFTSNNIAFSNEAYHRLDLQIL